MHLSVRVLILVYKIAIKVIFNYYRAILKYEHSEDFFPIRINQCMCGKYKIIC